MHVEHFGPFTDWKRARDMMRNKMSGGISTFTIGLYLLWKLSCWIKCPSISPQRNKSLFYLVLQLLFGNFETSFSAMPTLKFVNLRIAPWGPHDYSVYRCWSYNQNINKKLISLIPFKKWNLYNVYIHSTQTDIFQVFISFNFDDYNWQLMKTPNSVSQKIWILWKGSILKTTGATI